MNTRHISRLALAAGVVALGAGACILKDQEPPPFVGPSEFAMAIAMTANPDTVPEDGKSQSVIGILVLDPQSQPMRNVPLWVDTDLGAVSSHNVTTGTDGRTSVVFTAPESLTPGFDARNKAIVSATPIGTNFANSVTRTVSIRLVPTTVITVPGAPVANFTFTPATVKVNTLMFFDASRSFDSDGFIVSYAWDWGDGSFGRNSVTEEHDWIAPGTYFVRLTVTDNVGLTGFTVRPITITQ